MHQIHFIICSFLLVLSSILNASTKDRERIWVGMFGKKEIAEKNFFFTEAQLRYDLNTPTMQQNIIRFGGLHQLNLNHEIGLLGAYVQTGLVKEYRPTLQYTYFSNSNKFYDFSLRNRLESRFLEDQTEVSLRYRLSARVQKNITERLSLIIWDEPFINLTQEDWTGERTFERNRLFFGPRFKFNELNLEIGYLNQYIPRKDKNTMEHIIVTYLFF